jgi:hypothetical protein
MKRSKVPGAAFGKLCKSPPEINNETMKGEGKSVMKKPKKLNLGSTKRSEVPGAAYGGLRKSPPEVKDDTMKGQGKIVMKKPTKVNLGSTKSSEVPGAAYGKLCKSPPEVKDATMKGEGKIVMKTPTKETDETMMVEGDETMIVDASTELRTPQENSDVADNIFFDPYKEVVDSSADGLEPLFCGVETFLPSLVPVNQELPLKKQNLNWPFFFIA